MNERAAFVDQWMTLSTREEPHSFDEFVAQAETIIQTYVSQVTDPAGDIPPFLIIENEGQIDMIAWGHTSPEYSEHFLDRMVPETLASYDLSMVALVVCSSLRGRAGSGSIGEPEEVILLSVLSVSDENSRELARAAPIERRLAGPPGLGPFGPVEGGLAPAFAQALYAGFGSRLDESD